MPREDLARRAWMRPAAETAIALSAYTCLAFLYLRPFHQVWRDRVAPDLGDPLYVLYVLEWMQRQILLGLPNPFGANFFYPLDHSLLLSDHLFGLALQGLMLRPLTGGAAVATYNALLFIAYPLSGVTAALVVRACGASRPAAFLGGLVYAFAPYHWSQLPHLQVASYQWVPAVLWLFDRVIASPRITTAIGFLLFYALHVGGGSYLASMIHFPLLALLLYRALAGPGWREILRPRSMRILLPTGALATAIAAAALAPYLVFNGGRASWGAENFKLFGATLLSFVTPSMFNPHFEILTPLLRPLTAGYPGPSYWYAEKSFFLGVLPTILLLGGAVATWQRRNKTSTAPLHRGSPVAVALVALVVFAVIAADLFTLGILKDRLPPVLSRPGAFYTAIGALLIAVLAMWAGWLRRTRPHPPPSLHHDESGDGILVAGVVALALCFPVFYEPLSEAVPGLTAMRVPSRFFPFALLALALLCGRGTDALRHSLPSRAGRFAASALLIALVGWELAPTGIEWHPVEKRHELAEVYHWLDREPGVDAILELPLLPPPGEVVYMVRSTAHWKPIVNGFSGHFPPHYEELREICCWPAPDPAVLTTLRTWGVSHVVIHTAGMKRWERRELSRWTHAIHQGQTPGVTQVFDDPEAGDAVFRILP